MLRSTRRSIGSDVLLHDPWDDVAVIRQAP